MDNVKISIIIPVFNILPYLRDCLSSVAQQSFKDYEVIIVDDGSIDGSGKFCEDYLQSHKLGKNDRVIRIENSGVSVARNTALDCARGEYVFFMDGDDFFVSSDALSYLYKTAIDTGADIVRQDYVWTHQDGKYSAIEANMPKAIIMEVSEFVQTCNDKFFPWQFLIRRSRIGEVRFRPGMKIGEDCDFIVKVMVCNPTMKCCYTDHKLYGYRIRKNSASQQAFKSKMDDNLKMINSFYENASFCEEDKLKQVLFSLWAMYYYWNLWYMAKNVPSKEQPGFINQYFVGLYNRIKSYRNSISLPFKYSKIVFMSPFTAARILNVKYKVAKLLNKA